MNTSGKFAFLIGLSMASAALVSATTPGTTEATQSAQVLAQKVTLPSNLVLTPATQMAGDTTPRDHYSHVSHESHESHSSHYSSSI